MSNKKFLKREQRANRLRIKLAGSDRHRLCVRKTLKHIYAQLVTPAGDQTLAFASTLEPDLKSEIEGKTGLQKAEIIGARIAKKVLKLGIKTISFDRSGFKYHGKVKALAESARNTGLDF